MFPKDSTEHVLIAEPYRSKERFTLLDSKIGGLPVFLHFSTMIRSYGLQIFQHHIPFSVVVVGRKWSSLFKSYYGGGFNSSCMNQTRI